MEREQVNLAAIMFTDIVGYTSLTESDEFLALKLLNEHRNLVRPLITAHSGKEVKTMGDAFLVEFSSAVEATRCAFEIQDSFHRFNANQKANERIFLRIGVHLGDIVHSDRDVYGDAVNIASRIEALAEPGGICISRQVYDSVRSKMHDLKFDSLGLRQMKNVKNDFEVFRISMPWGESSLSSSSSSSVYRIPSNEDAQPKNRIAVLPFVNIGRDSTDEFFADGLTEELISRLSESKDLRVIARTSVMNYKNDKQKKIRDIGRELDAGTIVEGSVRKVGSKIRVTVKAVNAVNDEHLWSSTYDRNFDDIFEIQTDIATRVVESFSSNFTPLLRNQIRRSKDKEEPQNVTAYMYFLQGRHLLYGESEDSVKQALEFFSKAIVADPNFARAYVGRALSHLALPYFGRSPFVEEARMAEADVNAALKIDPDLAEAHATLSQIRYALDEFKEAEEEAEKAIELNPSLSDSYHALGHLRWIRGDLKESTKLYETAYKLDPLKEENIMMLSEMYQELGREEDSIELLSSVQHLFPQVAYSGFAWYYVAKHDFEKATEFLEKFKLAAGPDSITAMVLDGIVSAYKGEREKALDAISRIEKSSVTGTTGVMWNGFIYNALGDLDKFFECMNLSMEIHALPLGNLVNSKDFAEARKDPRFQEILKKINLKIKLPNSH